MPIGSRLSTDFCMLRIGSKPVSAHSSTALVGMERYRIKEVISDGGTKRIVFTKKGKHYYWSWNTIAPDGSVTRYTKLSMNDAIYKSDDARYKLMEFKDDKSALLWFKLEYGG